MSFSRPPCVGQHSTIKNRTQRKLNNSTTVRKQSSRVQWERVLQSAKNGSGFSFTRYNSFTRLCKRFSFKLTPLYFYVNAHLHLHSIVAVHISGCYINHILNLLGNCWIYFTRQSCSWRCITRRHSTSLPLQWSVS